MFKDVFDDDSSGDDFKARGSGRPALDKEHYQRKCYKYKQKYLAARETINQLKDRGRVTIEMNIAITNTSATDRQINELFENLGEAPSHSQISRLKDAVAEKVVQGDRSAAIAKMADFDTGCARRALFIRIGHDEFTALMRIVHRAKSRSQKVLAVLCKAFWSRDEVVHSVDIETELKVLSDKCAPTLAGALAEVIEYVSEMVAELPVGPSKVSIVICGDGIGTNVAATRRLTPFISMVFEVDTTNTNALCLPHSANLITSYGLLGPEKMKLQRHGAIDDIDGVPEEYADLARACSVLHKHLSPGEADVWVVRLSDREPEGGWPGRGGAQLTAEEENIVILCPWVKATAWDRHISSMVKTESHPTPTRFYIFGPCIIGLFLLSYFRLWDTLPGQGSARNKFVKNVLRNAGASLRISSLAWRICDHVIREASNTKTDKPPITRIPIIVTKCEDQTTFLIANIYRDPLVNTVACCARLITTMTRVHRYLSKFLAYPFKLWQISIKYNSGGYMTAARELMETTGILDSYTSSIRDQIRAYGAASDSVQSELECFVIAMNPDNLATERSINCVTRTARYSRRITTVAVASRSRTLKTRNKNQREIVKSAKLLAKRIKIVSGKKHHTPYSLTLQELKMYRACEATHPELKKEQDEQIAEYQAKHQKRLEEECEKRRKYAEKLKENKPMNYRTSCLEEWVSWRLNFPEAWSELMATAGDARRKRLNRLTSATEQQWPDQPEYLAQTEARCKSAKSKHSNSSLVTRMKWEDNAWYCVATRFPQQMWIILFTMDWAAVFTKGRKTGEKTMRVSITQRWYAPLLEVLPDNASLTAFKLTLANTLVWDDALNSPAISILDSAPIEAKPVPVPKPPSNSPRANQRRNNNNAEDGQQNNKGNGKGNGNGNGRGRKYVRKAPYNNPGRRRNIQEDMPEVIDDEEHNLNHNSDEDGIYSDDFSDCELVRVDDPNEEIEIDDAASDDAEAPQEEECQEGDESEDDLSDVGEKYKENRKGKGTWSKSDGYITTVENMNYNDIRFYVKGKYRDCLPSDMICQHQLSKKVVGRAVVETYIRLFILTQVTIDKWWTKKESRRSAVQVREIELEEGLKKLSKEEMVSLHTKVEKAIKDGKWSADSWTKAREDYHWLNHTLDNRPARALVV